MTIFKVMAFLVALSLSVLVGSFAFKYIGWWGFIPASFLGFLLIAMWLIALRNSFIQVATQIRKILQRLTKGASPK